MISELGKIRTKTKNERDIQGWMGTGISGWRWETSERDLRNEFEFGIYPMFILTRGIMADRRVVYLEAGPLAKILANKLGRWTSRGGTQDCRVKGGLRLPIPDKRPLCLKSENWHEQYE